MAKLLISFFLVSCAVGVPAWASEEQDVAKLVTRIDRYVASVEASLGNPLERIIHKKLGTKKYKSTTKKVHRLKRLKSDLENDEINTKDLLLTILKEGPYNDSQGKLFLENSRKLVLKMARKNIPIERRTCSICYEEGKTQFVVFNCGHASVCVDCYKRSPTKCPFCRSNIKKPYRFTFCILCAQRPATTSHEGCLHLDTCENCLEEIDHTSCLICGNNKEHKTIKLFY